MGLSGKARKLIYVIFTESGIPGWFGPEPVAGSEPLDLEELAPLLPDGALASGQEALWRDVLAGHFRQDGRWLPREGAAVEVGPAVGGEEPLVAEVDGGEV